MPTNAAKTTTAAETQREKLQAREKTQPAEPGMVDELTRQELAHPEQLNPRVVMHLQRTAGNRAVMRLLKQHSIQPKLTVGAADDSYEQEADRVAGQVLAMPASPAPASTTPPSPAVQRESGEEEEEVQMKAQPLAASVTRLQRHDGPEEENAQASPIQRQDVPEEEEVQASRIQRPADGSFSPTGDFEERLGAARSGGEALPEGLRADFEPRFGADFSTVRVHTGADSNTLNREIQAGAFTSNSDIFFADGQYDPNSQQGKELLAHELTHTIQQGAAPVKSAQRQADPELARNLTHTAPQGRVLGRMQQEQLTTNANRSLQRHPVGKELTDKDAQVTEVSEKEKMAPGKLGGKAILAPEATRTPQVELAEKKAGKEAGKAFTNSQKLTPGAMGLASAEKILQGAYGGIKKIVPGTIVILADQAACSAKYDEVCMADGLEHNGVPWQAGDCAKDDAAAGVLTEGFAWKGVVYVNGATTLVTATAHEILHNNTEPKFRDVVGETFNEGVTETLARKALRETGVKVPSVTAYPLQVELTKLLIDLVGIDVVEKAYFQDVQELVRMYNRKGSSTWAKVKQAAEALDTDKVKIALKRGFGT